VRRSARWAAAALALTPLAALAKQPSQKPAGKTVEGVTVTGQGTEFRSSIDRRSYDISKDLQTTTGSIADALRNVPSLDVDVNGNVSLRGDSNVTIMIDSKPTNLFKGPAGGQTLQSFPADQFERVEVITNPTAAYSPEGTAGIINLVTKKVRKAGRSGSLRANLGGAGRRNASVTGAYNSAKVALTGNLAARHDPQHSRIEDFRQTVDTTTGETLTSNRNLSFKGPVDLWTARAAIDYDVGAKTRLSAELRHNDFTYDPHTVQSFITTDATGAVVGDVPQTGSYHQETDTTSGSGGFRRQFGQDHDLNVNLSQERTLAKYDEQLTNIHLVPAATDSFRDILQRGALEQTELKADYNRPMPNEAKLKAGYDLRINDNRYDVVTRVGTGDADAIPNPVQSDLFLYKQTLNAAYLTYEQPVGDFTALAGLRYEDERLDLDQVTMASRLKREEGRLYPSLHLAYRLSEAQQLTASYSERVQRPSPEDLNPFVLVESTVASQGNPNLEPQITHSFEAAWQLKENGTYYLATLFYRLNDHGVTTVVSDLGHGIFLNTKENLSRSRNAGLELVANGKLGKTLSYNASVNLYWAEIESQNLGLAGVNPRRSDLAGGGRASLNWQATPNDLFQVTGIANPKRLIPQGFYEPMFLVFLGYQHKFSDSLSLVVTAQDPFGIYRFREVLDTPLLHEHFTNRARIQAAFVGFTWNFGGGAKKRAEPAFEFSAPQ